MWVQVPLGQQIWKCNSELECFPEEEEVVGWIPTISTNNILSYLLTLISCRKSNLVHMGSSPTDSTNGIKAHKDVQTLNRVRLGFEFQIFHIKIKKVWKY